MRCLPSLDHRAPQLGIRQIEDEYRQRWASRVQSVRVSGGALLLSVATHVVLTAAFIAGVIKRGSLFPIEHVASFLGATLCVLPVTCFLARLYTHSLDGAREARTQLIELESLQRKRSRRAVVE